MLILKPLTEDCGRPLVQTSQQSLSLRIQEFGPHTCTYVRLLGPCFKTGQTDPFRQHLGAQGTHVTSATCRSQGSADVGRCRRHSTRHLARTPQSARRQCGDPPIARRGRFGSAVIPLVRTDVGARDAVHRDHSRLGLPQSFHHCESPTRRITTAPSQTTGPIRFSLQRIQALVTFFPKSFSPFPHGTCILSVSKLHLAWGGIYHLLGAPIQRNVTP